MAEPGRDTGSGRPLLDKLGVMAGARISLTDTKPPPGFLAELRERTQDVFSGRPRRNSDLLFWEVAQPAQLHRLRDLRRYIKDTGAIWVIRAKGKTRTVRETDIIDAARAAGLVDNKIASFSDTQSAMRLVVPLALRRSGRGREASS